MQCDLQHLAMKAFSAGHGQKGDVTDVRRSYRQNGEGEGSRPLVREPNQRMLAAGANCRGLPLSRRRH